MADVDEEVIAACCRLVLAAGLGATAILNQRLRSSVSTVCNDDLKAVYGPVKPCSTPVRDIDGTLLTDKAHILKRWADHFQTVLNRPSNFDDCVLDELPGWPVDEGLDAVPTLDEVRKSVGQMSSGKAPGTDGMTAEVLKNGNSCLLEHLTKLFGTIWKVEAVPQDFKDALIVHLYKRKGNRACCDNHSGISLLSIAGKVLARVLLNRLSHHVHSNDIIPERQSGFRTCRGTMDVIFTARQLQESAGNSIETCMPYLSISQKPSTR